MGFPPIDVTQPPKMKPSSGSIFSYSQLPFFQGRESDRNDRDLDTVEGLRAAFREAALKKCVANKTVGDADEAFYRCLTKEGWADREVSAFRADVQASNAKN